MTKTWKCPHGCELSSVPCQHLEKLLPQMSKARGKNRCVKAFCTDKIENLADARGLNPDLLSFKNFSQDVFVHRLKKFGMEQWRVDLLSFRFVHCYTLSEIKEIMGFTSIGVVAYCIKQCLNSLKERGLKPNKQ